MPEKLLRWRPVRLVVRMTSIYFVKDVPRSAAALAYFLTLTIFPILICVNAFFSRLHLNLVRLLQDLSRFLPAGVAAILTEYLNYLSANQSPGMFIAGVAGTIFLASAAVRALMSSIKDVYGSTSFTGPWQLLASVGISILLLIAVYLSVFVVLTGNWFFNLIGEVFHLENLLQRFGAWQSVKYILLFGMIFLVILLLYRFSLPLGKPRPPVVAGAFLASVALAAASALFSYFISLSTRYSLVYGSLASVMILLVWLYLCGNILILGSVFNYVLHCMAQESDRPAQ